MSIVDRAKRVSLHPQSEWPVIAAEPATVGGIYTGYVVPLAAIGPVALIIGLSIIGVTVPFIGTYRTPIVAALLQGILTFTMVLIGVAIMSFIARILAPTFGGRNDTVASFKLVGYAYTPAFVAGILGLIPQLSFLELFAALWTLYVFYTGAAPLQLATREKAAGYTAACVVCSIVVGFIGISIVGVAGFTTHALGGSPISSRANSEEQGKAVVAGMLGAAMGGGAANQADAKKVVDSVESAGKAADVAQSSGDTNAQVAAGMKMMTSLVHGGKDAVKPIAHNDLKALLPASAGGLDRTAAEGSSGSFAGIAGSSADAKYGSSGGPSIEINVADLGNMGGIAAVANIGANLQVENDSDTGYEKNVDVDGRRVHEKWTNDGKKSSLLQIVDNRFAVSVDGSGVDMDTAVSALRAVDMAKFQALGAAAR